MGSGVKKKGISILDFEVRATVLLKFFVTHFSYTFLLRSCFLTLENPILGSEGV